MIWSTALLTVLSVRIGFVPGDALLIADALGLSLFALSGAQIAEDSGLASVIVVLMGTMTGVAGGVLRDVLSSKVPLLFRKDIYATAAVAGIGIYLLLQTLGLKRSSAFGIGIIAVVTIRLCALHWNWQLPAFHLAGS